MFTSHDNITIVTNPIPVVEELTEVVEIVDGSGGVAKPVLALVTVAWQDVDLGVLNTNGTELIPETPGTSLVSITYTTQYHECTVTAIDAEQVQVYMEGD